MDDARGVQVFHRPLEDLAFVVALAHVVRKDEVVVTMASHQGFHVANFRRHCQAHPVVVKDVKKRAGVGIYLKVRAWAWPYTAAS